MSENLIEGIGDDVTYAVGALAIIAFLTSIWWSTRVESSRNHEPEPEVEETQQVDEMTSSPPEDSVEGTFTVRLKYLDDTEREIEVFGNLSVEDFRRRCFPVSETSRFSLIFRGRILRDGSNLRSYGIVQTTNAEGVVDVPVIHCFQVQNQNSTNQTQNDHFDEIPNLFSDLRIHFLPILGFLLAVFWGVFFTFSSCFNLVSVINLLVISSFFFILVFNHYA